MLKINRGNIKKTVIWSLVVLSVGTGAAIYGRTLGQRLVGQLWPAEEEPLPMLTLTPCDYTVEVKAEGELTGLETQIVSAPQVRWHGSLKVSQVAQEGSVVKAGDMVLKFDRSEAATKLEQNENTVQSYVHRINKSTMDYDSSGRILDMDRKSAQLGMEYARTQVRKDEDIFSRWEIQESLLNAALAGFRKDVLEQKGKAGGVLAKADQAILNIEQGQAKAEVNRAQETLNALEVKAPIMGVVMPTRGRMQTPQVGSEAWPGMPLMDIARMDRFQGRLYIPEADIAGVEAGKSVKAELDSLPGIILSGSVRKVARVAEARNEEDPLKYFTCEVTWNINPELITKLKPGMRFRASVETGLRHGALVVPKCAVIKKDNKFRVFVKGGPKGFTERLVTILEADHGFCSLQGVKAGEVVALRHPFEKQELKLPDFNAPMANEGTQMRMRFFH